jgi:hypothetical protein
VVQFGNVWTDLKSLTPTTIGGLFHFEQGVAGTATSISNNYFNCHTTELGAVWYLSTGFNLIEKSSTYKGNAGKAGMIYCY